MSEQESVRHNLGRTRGPYYLKQSMFQDEAESEPEARFWNDPTYSDYVSEEFVLNL